MTERTKMTTTIDRRSFFRHFFGQTAVFTDEARGKPQLRLADLPQLSSECIRAIIPILAPGVRREKKDGHENLNYPLPDGTEAAIEISDRESQIYTHLTGWQSIAKISSELAQEWQCDEENAFEQIRSCFLKWTQLGICHPRNPI